MAVQFENFYESTLSGPISATDLVIPINTPPSVTEGWLLLDYDVPSKREFIYFTARSGTNVTVPSLAVGRGRDSTVAISHTQNAKVRMNVSAGLLDDVSGNSAAIVNANNNGGWVALAVAPTTITNNGQRSQTLTFSGVDYTDRLNPSTRLMTQRTVAAPVQSTALNGTTQYWNKTSPNKLTFTDDFVVDAYVKLTSYAVGGVVSRYNGTSGWTFTVEADGTLKLRGFNAGSGNKSEVNTYQTIPLNKWVRITAQLDMSTFTATTTTSYVMIDGVDVPSAVIRAGTNPTALIQAGNLEIGSYNGGTSPFPGKIAQVAIFNAKVTQAQMRTYHSQGYTGSEANLVSAYSFDGVATDLMTATPNDLTAMNAVGYVNNSPFGTQASGLISSTLDYLLVSTAVFTGGNTVVTGQVPEGCTIPTSGGVSAVSYSGVKAPYGFPADSGKWNLSAIYLSDLSGATLASGAGIWNKASLTTPIGSWSLGYWGTVYGDPSAGNAVNARFSLNTQARSTTGGGAVVNDELKSNIYITTDGPAITLMDVIKAETSLSLSSATEYNFFVASVGTAYSSIGIRGDYGPFIITAKNGLL